MSKPEPFALVGSGGEPWGWMAYGHWGDQEFVWAVRLQEAVLGLRAMRLDPAVERGWGRWVTPPAPHLAKVVLRTGCWPIPLFNFRYTKTRTI